MNYDNSVVNDKLHDLVEFEWNDNFSEGLLAHANLEVEVHDEIILPSKVKYTGQWAGNQRHGMGS